MLVLHVYIMGEKGNIARTFDFLRNDGKEELEGVDIVIPYEKDTHYPLTESETVAIISNMGRRGDH